MMSPRRNWDSPTPFLASECAPPPPDQRVGGYNRLSVRGWGSANSYDWRKSPALCGVDIECVSLINDREKLVRTDSRPQVQCREGGGEETFTISGRHVSV
jgi:hypothetical protein